MAARKVKVGQLYALYDGEEFSATVKVLRVFNEVAGVDGYSWCRVEFVDTVEGLRKQAWIHPRDQVDKE